MHTAAASRKNYEVNEIQKFSWIGNVCNKRNISDKEDVGIHQMDASIWMMNGKFLIESTIGEGTTIAVELPLVEI